MRASSEISHLSQNWLNLRRPAAYVDRDETARAPVIDILADSTRAGGNWARSDSSCEIPNGVCHEKRRSTAITLGRKELGVKILSGRGLRGLRVEVNGFIVAGGLGVEDMVEEWAG